MEGNLLCNFDAVSHPEYFKILFFFLLVQGHFGKPPTQICSSCLSWHPKMWLVQTTYKCLDTQPLSYRALGQKYCKTFISGLYDQNFIWKMYLKIVIICDPFREIQTKVSIELWENNRAVRLIEIEIKSRFEIARFLNRFIARFFFCAPAPTSRSMLSEPIRMQQNRTDRAYRQIVCWRNREDEFRTG